MGGGHLTGSLRMWGIGVLGSASFAPMLAGQAAVTPCMTPTAGVPCPPAGPSSSPISTWRHGDWLASLMLLAARVERVTRLCMWQQQRQQHK